VPATSLQLSVSSSSDAAIEPNAHGLQSEVLSLFDECADGLRRYVAAFGLSSATADDVVQETFLALFRHLTLGRPRHHLRGWLYFVAHNLALKQRQRAARWSRMDGDLTLASALVDDAPDPEQRVADRQRRERLCAVARALPERDRQCLYLRAEGLNYREIAKALNLSLGSVSKSLTRAFARLANSEAR
jgi:RNA polymerase sigma-70 factor, ECF subfamily